MYTGPEEQSTSPMLILVYISLLLALIFKRKCSIEEVIPVKDISSSPFVLRYFQNYVQGFCKYAYLLIVRELHSRAGLKIFVLHMRYQSDNLNSDLMIQVFLEIIPNT